MKDEAMDDNIGRLLRDAAGRNDADAAFRERLLGQLQRETRSPHAAPAVPAAALRHESIPGGHRDSRPMAPAAESAIRTFLRAAALVASIGFAGATAWWLWSDPLSVTVVLMQTPAGSWLPAPASLPPGQPAVLAIPTGQRARVALEDVAKLELRDGAELTIEPGSVASIRLTHGVLRAVAVAPLCIQIADLRIDAAKDADIEALIAPKGEHLMNAKPFIAGALFGGAIVTVAVILHQGRAELNVPGQNRVVLTPGTSLELDRPASRPESVGEVVDGTANTAVAVARARATALEMKVAELQKKYDATKKEADGLHAELALKKGITIETVMKRIDELKKNGLESLVQPGATADLISALKDLGAAGTTAMMNLLKSDDENARFLAARLLESLSDPEAITGLREAAMNDSSEMVKNQASHALALMGDPRATEALRDIVHQPQTEGGLGARINSMYGLAALHDAEGLKLCLEYISNKDNPDQLRAALGQGFMLGHDEGVISLVDAYVSSNRESPGILKLAVSYYKSLNSEAGRAHLSAIAGDPTVPQRIRDAASAALH